MPMVFELAMPAVRDVMLSSGCFLLRFRRRHRFGPEADSLPRVPTDIPGYDPEEQLPFDPEGELDCSLDAIEFAPEDPDTAWPEPSPDEQ